MNKFKKILLGTLSVLTLGLFAVVGTKVNAATAAGEYDLIDLLGETYTPSTTNLTNIADHSIFKNFVSSKKIQYLNASSEYTGEVDVTGKNAVQLRENTSGFDIVLDLATGQTASLTLSTYGKKDKGLHVGDNSTIVMTGYDGLITKTYDLSTGTTHVYGTGNVSLLEFVVTVNDPATKTLSSISASGTTSFYTGDAIPSASDVTVTATYSEGDPVVLKSGYDITITKKNDTTPITSVFDEAGDYTITASYTYKGVTKTDDYEVTVTDVVKHTVTYYDADMTTSHEVKVVDGESFSASPFKFGCNLIGWATTANATEANVDVSSVTTDLEVYPVFADMCLQLNQNYTFTKTAGQSQGTNTVNYRNSPDGTYFIENNVESSSEKGVSISSSAFTFSNGIKDGKNYMAFRIPANSHAIINLNAKRASDSDSTKYARLYFNNENTKTDNFTTEFADYSVTYCNNSDSSTIVKIYRDGNKTVTVSNISVSVKANTSTTVTATLYKQFDKNTNPTMLRLMGKIEGIAYADYENISNVLMEFDFNNGTTTTSKSAYCYKLYKSIKTLDGSLDADEDGKTMYVVLTISGLEKYSSMSFTNVKMTITFSDGSTKEATHTNF